MFISVADIFDITMKARMLFNLKKLQFAKELSFKIYLLSVFFILYTAQSELLNSTKRERRIYYLALVKVFLILSLNKYII